MAPKAVANAIIDTDPETYEAQNVHAIYDSIASHFASTRYKPWPIIARFLSEIPNGWIGLDSGTGNGKYLPLDRQGSICTIGLDRSLNLLKIAKNAGNLPREVVLGNVLDRCWRLHAFDYAISIATIHHLATEKRRVTAIQRLLQTVSPSHGRILIYVWAIEQDALSKRTIPRDEQGESKSGKDVVVPWVLAKNLPKTNDPTTANQHDEVFNRYYHMFARGELTKLACKAAAELCLQVGPKPSANEISACRGVEVVQDGWERSNYYVELRCWDNP